MKHRSTQLDRRQTPDSLRVHGSRTVVNSSAGVEEDSDSKVRFEAFSPPRMRVFELPLSHMESTVGIVLKSNSNQKQADAGIETCEEEHRRSRGKWSVSPLWEPKTLLGVFPPHALPRRRLVNSFE